MESEDQGKEALEPSTPSPSPLLDLSFKWKRWHWYMIFIFNISIPILISINRILIARDLTKADGNGQLAMMAVLPPLILSFLVVYFLKASKEYQECKILIKGERIKYFQKGLISSVISFTLLLVALVVSYKVTDNNKAASIVIYTFLSLTFILGTISMIFVTMYEFCVCFDIFYNKNKEKIISAHLSQQGFKIKEEEENIDES